MDIVRLLLVKNFDLLKNSNFKEVLRWIVLRMKIQ